MLLRVGLLFLLLAVLTPAASAVQPAPTSVTIAVPAVQVLEGPSSVSVLPGIAYRTTLTVKSNVPWVLIARAGEGDGAVTWRRGGLSRWALLSAITVLAGGEKGIYPVEIELRCTGPTAGQPVAVTFELRVAR